MNLNKRDAGFVECDSCGSLWRVMATGRIDFAPRSPAMAHVCRDCMKAVIEESEQLEKASAQKTKRKTRTKKAEKPASDDAES